MDFFLWMHEWVCNTGWRHRQDIFQLLPPLYTIHNITGVKQTWEKLSSLLWHQITGQCPHSFFISDRQDPNVFSILCNHYERLFFLSSKANHSIVLFEFAFVFLEGCQPHFKLSHLLLQPVSSGFIFIQITNKKPLRARFANRTAHIDSLLCLNLKC